LNSLIVCILFDAQTTLKGGKDLLTDLQLPLPDFSNLFADDNGDAAPSPEPPAAVPAKKSVNAKPASKPAAKGGQLSVFDMDSVN
jgi:hypothetical protein